MRASGPYPILALTGEGGAAKTSTARLLRSLVDPHLASVRRPPQSERDLFVGASKTSVLVYDNLSGIPDWLSDALCVIATGGAYTARQGPGGARRLTLLRKQTRRGLALVTQRAS